MRVRACVRALRGAESASYSRRVLVQPLVRCLKQCAEPAQGAKRRGSAGEVCCGARVAECVDMRLALVVGGARGWCGRRGTAMGPSTGQTHMTQASGRYACVCVRAGTYAQFSRGVRGEGHEGRRPRVYWRVRVRGARRRRGPKAGRSLPSLATTRLQRNLGCLRL